MLHEQLRDEWHARKRAVPIYPVMTFAPEGLVLGAGTVLLQAEGPGRLQSLRSQEARVLALLAAAYGKTVAPAVLGNIERAAKSWRDGDRCLAHIHLAHSGLHAPSDLGTAAYRLFIAEHAMKAGMIPRAIFQALTIDRSYADAVEKAFNPDEPRVPAGSGRSSGEWTDDEKAGGDVVAGGGPDGERAQGPSLLGRMPSPPPAGFMGALDAAQVAELGAYASRILGLAPVSAAAATAAAVFGLLFVPSPNNVRVEGEVPEIPGLRYAWNRDETLLHLTYDRGGGAQRTFALQIDGDLIRDDDGQVVGRVVGENRIAIDTLAVLPDLLKQDEPRLCPAYAPDVAGSDQGKPYEKNRPRQYEDFIKLLINPPPTGPTPSGYVYYLPNPQGGEPVSYDDCKWTNGILFEIKGERYAALLTSPIIAQSIADDFLGQSDRQIAASQGRPVVWIFAEENAAEFARELFGKAGKGRERITVGYVAWTRANP